MFVSQVNGYCCVAMAHPNFQNILALAEKLPFLLKMEICF